MKVTVSAKAILSHKAEAVIVGTTAAAAPAGPAALIDRNCGEALTRLLTGAEYEGKAGQSAILRPGKGHYPCIIVVGLGQADHRDYQIAVRAGFKAAVAAGLQSTVCALPACADDKEVQVASGEALRLAATLAISASYKFKTGRRSGHWTLATVILQPAKSGGPSEARREVATGTAIGEGTNLARHLAEQPPNICTPEFIAATARSLARQHGLKTKVFDERALRQLKMNGILAVGSGSRNPARLIVVSHRGGQPRVPPVVLIGKGVTFDTGGISIKPGAAMDEMKFDMGGAAGVLGTMLAIARMRLALNVVAIVPSVENMPDGNAYRPGDILTMYSGATVEVLNTDAEGRLILADALAYAERKFKPSLIIDAATLTGACVIALGNHRSALLAREDKLAEQLLQAGELAGDLCWRLPLDQEYDDLLKSDYADFPHIAGGRAAGTITAACFLGRFVKTQRWAHLDIAGTAWTKNKRATGRPVPLLATFLAIHAGKIKTSPE